MKYKVGFIGCNKNDKNEVYPVTGWIVSPDTKEEKEEVDEDEENYLKPKDYKDNYKIDYDDNDEDNMEITSLF